MKNFCEKHHLSYIGNRCPICEKERISSFRVSKSTRPIPGQAPRELYFSEYMKPEPAAMTDIDTEDKLIAKCGKVSKLK